MPRPDAERTGAGQDIPRQVDMLRRGLSVLIIFTHDEQWDLPLGNNIHRFIKGPFTQRTVPNIDDPDRLIIAQLVPKGISCRNRYDPALDPVGKEIIVTQMLAAADTPAGTGSLAQQLGHQPPNISRKGNIMSVASMI